MASDTLFSAIILVMLAVMVVLMLGLGSFGKGGSFARKHSNKMMRYRIIAQAVAIGLILLYVYLFGKAG